jgi:CheY-like chemotaxis protein
MASLPRVLVVDDDPGVLQSLGLLLGDECEVKCCASPREALTLATQTPFDVVVVDFKMPVMTGAQFAAELKAAVANPPYCLMLTGTPDQVTRETPGASELVMVVAKPFEPGRLLRLVTQVGKLGLLRRTTAA